MDIVEKLRDERVYVYTQVVEPTDLMKEAANEILRLREQLAASQAECIALQNRMDEQVTAWRAEWMAAENKLAETDALPLPAARGK